MAADSGGYSPVSGDARLGFFSIALLVCTSIPVSRKKFLTFGTSSCNCLAAGREGSLHERRPMRLGQILLCQPVVTDHNSFSVQPSVRRGHQSRITHGTTINPVSGDSVAPYAGVRLEYTSGLRQRLTSYRLPLVLNKKGYKHMLR